MNGHEKARLTEGPAPELIHGAFRREIGDAAVLWPGLDLADLAHAVMLVEAGILPPAPGAALLGLLLDLHRIPAEELPLDPALEDATMNREAWLRRRDDVAAGWLGAGRARREPASIAYRIAVRRRLLGLPDALAELCASLTDVAAAHRDTVMPDYTYLQHAQPTSLAHYLLSFAYPTLRDLDRLRACFGRINQSPAGIGSINGSRLPVQRERLAVLLGFDGVVINTRDAMWQADGPVEVAAAVMAALLNVDRLAEDLQIWATVEFDMAELADRHARTSFIMPQKKNPYALAYLRGMTNIALGTLVSMAAVGRSPSAQVDNRIFAIGAIPRALDDAVEAVRLMAAVLRGITFRTDRMRARARDGYGQATDLAEVLMQAAGIDFRAAHRIVGTAIRLAIEAGAPAGTVPAALLDRAAASVLGRPLALPAEVLDALADPAAIVATRTGTGGAAAPAVDAMLAECRQARAAGLAWIVETRARLGAAEDGLLARAAELAAGVASR
jgi:argininosuccinate lyase